MVRQRSAKPLFAGSIPAVASKSLSLPVPPDFSFRSTVESHGWYLLEPFRWSAAEEVLRRAETLGEAAADLEIRFERGSKSLRVSMRYCTPSGRIEPAEIHELRQRLTRMFQLRVDTGDFLDRCRGLPSHAWVSEACFGRLLCSSTLFEDAIKIITTTNTMWRQTVRMVELLVANCGRESPGGRRAFPKPEDVLRFDVGTLQETCRLGYRAKFIHALATGVVNGSIDFARISDPSQTTEELFASYRTLPGIGPYGAAHLLAMDGRHDFIAVDTEFRRFVRERYHGGRKVSDRTLLKRYARWGRWKYLAYWAEVWKNYQDSEVL